MKLVQKIEIHLAKHKITGVEVYIMDIEDTLGKKQSYLLGKECAVELLEFIGGKECE